LLIKSYTVKKMEEEEGEEGEGEDEWSNFIPGIFAPH
jgi:hypothetical protein